MYAGRQLAHTFKPRVQHSAAFLVNNDTMFTCRFNYIDNKNVTYISLLVSACNTVKCLE